MLFAQQKFCFVENNLPSMKPYFLLSVKNSFLSSKTPQIIRRRTEVQGSIPARYEQGFAVAQQSI